MRARSMLLVLSVVAGCAREVPEPAQGDVRTVLDLTPDHQQAVLAEMRTMLGSLNGVLAGLVTYDTAAMQRAALASGMATAADPALEQVLPEAFLTQGVATHLQFDSLAAAIAAGAPRDSLVARLGRLTGSCVGCHATYRLGRR